MIRWFRFSAAAALVAASLATSATPVRSAPQNAGAVLDALLHRWSTVHDYQVDIDQHEVSGARVEDHTMHYALLLSPAAARVVVTGGAQRGMELVWHGGDKVSVFHGGFLSFAKMSLSIGDKLVTSVRGNTIMSADPSTVLSCFQAHRDQLLAVEGPVLNGKATQELAMDRASGVGCPDEPADDKTVTRDVLLISPDTQLPVERMRYVGTTLVERWRLTNLKLNAGLTAASFK